MNHSRSQRVPGRLEALLLIAILVIGGGLRLAYLAEIRDDPGLAHPPVDAGFNLYWARGLATGDWTLPPDADGRDPEIRETAYIRPPGYPYVLAALYRITGGAPLAIRAFQMAAGLAAAALAWWVGRRLLSPAAGLVWAGLMAVHWGFIYFEADLNGSWLLTVLFPPTVLALYRFAASSRWGDAALVGTFIGLAALVRSNALLLGPVLAPWLLVVAHRRGGAQRAWACLTAAGLAGALTLLPSTVRNLRVSGHLVPVSANGGITLYNGNNPRATGTSAAVAGDAGYFASPWHGADLAARASERQGRPVSYVEASRGAGREALGWIRANPRAALRLVGARVALFWGPDEMAHSSPVAADRMASSLLRRLPFPFAVIFAAAVWGPAVWAFARRRSAIDAMTGPAAAAMVAVALTVAGWFVSFLPFLVTSLYRMSVVPALLLAAAVGVTATVRLARAGKPHLAMFGAASLVVLWLVARVPVVAVEPGVTERLVQRGAQWRAQGDQKRAEAELREALRLSPESLRAANGLAAVLLDQGRFKEAAALLGPAAASNPADPALHFNLGLARLGLGDWSGAATSLRTAAELAPNLVEAQLLLASACERLGDRENAIRAYERALALAPDRVDVSNNLAWLLATAPEDRLRDGARAVALARRAVAAQRSPATLDTLAAALAEAGRFDDAVATLEEAQRITPRGSSAAAGDLEARLEAYRAGRGHRSPPEPQ